MPDGNHTAPPATNTRGSHWPAFSKYVEVLDGSPVQPCPFCADTKDGGNLLEYALESCEPPVFYRYQCAHCCTEGPTKESPREALEAWNSRAALTLDDLPRLTDEDREAVESGYVALQGVPVGTAAHADPPTTNDDQQDVWLGVDELYAARAILECYIESIPDSRADDRYVLWAVRDKIDAANSIIQATSTRPQVAHG